jgi:hypothetical protein
MPAHGWLGPAHCDSMKIYLIDGTYELFRNYYGAPPKKTPEGREIGATVGVLRSLLALLQGSGATHVACAFDHVIESFRNDLFADYKTGDGIEPDLLGQFEPVERGVAALGVTVWSMVEFEADDALATAASRFGADPGVDQVLICSPDKIWPRRCPARISSAGTAARPVLDEPAVQRKFGVSPESILIGSPGGGFRRRISRHPRLGGQVRIGRALTFRPPGGDSGRLRAMGSAIGPRGSTGSEPDGPPPGGPTLPTPGYASAGRPPGRDAGGSRVARRPPRAASVMRRMGRNRCAGTNRPLAGRVTSSDGQGTGRLSRAGNLETTQDV